MKRPFVFKFRLAVFFVSFIALFPLTVSGQKYIETLEYLRLSIDASSLVSEKMSEVESYVVNVARSLSDKRHSSDVSDWDMMNLRQSCATMRDLVKESYALMERTLQATEDAVSQVDAESVDESWEQVMFAKSKFEKSRDFLMRSYREFELAHEQADFESFLNCVKQAVQHTLIGKTHLEEGEEALRSSVRWLQ